MTFGQAALSVLFVAFGAAAMTKGTSRVLVAAPAVAAGAAPTARGPAPMVALNTIAPPESDWLEVPDTRALDRPLVVELNATARSDRTDLELRTPAEWGRPNVRRLRLHREDVPAVTPSVRAVAEVAGSAVVILDEYPAPRCTGGRDAFLRVISVAGPSTRETWRRRVARCDGAPTTTTRQALSWDPLAATLRVALAAPEQGARGARIALRIRGDGTVDDKAQL